MADSEKTSSVIVEKHNAEADSTPQSPQNIPFSPKQYRKLIWKLDIRLIPPLVALWAASLIDRVNIGAAKIQGLEADLGMDPLSNQFNIALVVIFVGLITCEIPSNWAMRKFSPSKVLCAECFLLGIFIVSQGFVTNFAGLAAMRVMVGIFEAGLIPGSVYLLGHYYPRYELQWRMSMLMVGNALSNAFGGLLALAIANIHSSNGYHGWRWIFIIEGCMTIGVTLVAYPFMTDWPETTKWLTGEEKAVLADKIRSDGIIGRMDRLDSKAVIRMLSDWKVYICSVMYIGTVVTLYSITIFAPSIITQFSTNKTPTYVQSLVIPIFVASAIATLITAYVSDRLKHRFSFSLLGYAFTGAGLLIMMNQKSVSSNTKYGALYLMGVGSYISMPLVWTMVANNGSGVYKTAYTIGMVTGLGSAGGIISALIFQGSQAPLYSTGYNVSFGAVCITAGATCVYVVGLWLENRARNAGKRDHRLTAADADNLGDDHPHFRYGY